MSRVSSDELVCRFKKILQIKPLSAYQIMQEHNKKFASIQAQTVYRVLEKMQKKKLLHKIDSEKTFILCNKKHNDEDFIFFICRKCAKVIEHSMPENILYLLKENYNFFNLTNFEIKGDCIDCIDCIEDAK